MPNVQPLSAGTSEARAETKLDLAIVNLCGRNLSNNVDLSGRVWHPEICAQRGSVVRMVECIEEFESELKTQTFSNLDVFVERGIYSDQRRTDHAISP